MIEINESVRAFIDKAIGSTELSADEYIEPADGLIHCKKCGGRRQTILPDPLRHSYLMPRCVCPCQQETQRQKKAAEEQRALIESIQRRRAQGLQDRYLHDFTFANDNGQNPLMDKARAYVENWKEAYRENTGLLLFGDVGTGKSFFAGCIANALIDRDIPVLMTNIPTILNRLTGMFAEGRAVFISGLDDYSLLILDDLGVERNTEYALEQMFLVIDSRYRSRKPLIVTTNLKLEEIKNPPDLAHARIYDRIMERCAPVLFTGKNFREENAEIPDTAQKTITFKKMYRDGICQVSSGYYTKMVEFFDINYDLLEIEDQGEILEEYSRLINYFEPSIRFELFLFNRQVNEQTLIDGAVAAIMALDRAVRNGGSTGSVYDERGILSF